MGNRLRAWWQKITSPLDAVITIFLLVLFALIIVIICGYLLHWNWTGLTVSSSTSIATEIDTATHKITRTISQQPGKTLWDWLQLLVIPAVLAIGGYLFNYTTSENERKSRDSRDKTASNIALDNQREAILQSYIDKVSQMLLEKKLSDKATKEAKTIGRVRTLTTFPHLDGQRKRVVLMFLYETRLLDKDHTIVPLKEADLSFINLISANLHRANLSGTILFKADLRFVDLSGADLSDANLTEADLSFADLSDANLSGADFSGADLSGANLSRADLSGAIIFEKQLNQAISLKDVIMVDGSKHQ
ncbi:MAG TPA: pentapeptide repeat-containing protein [Ktedonobacteraceae bacterium]|jgi:uncharacterized protein YjbI with pentapeptide repeats|nr:pentapeptide repeat-containing protein [Ktedonobacteraceae bacterium]